MKTDLLKIYAKSNLSSFYTYVIIVLLFSGVRIRMYELPIEPHELLSEIGIYGLIISAAYLALMKTRDLYRKTLSEKTPLRERDCTEITLQIALLKAFYMVLWLYFLFMPLDSPGLYQHSLGYAFIFFALGIYASVSAAYLPLFLWDIGIQLAFAAYVLWLHRNMDETPYLAGIIFIFAFYTFVSGLRITKTTKQLVESGYALKKAATAANRANKSKSEFLAVMSHEIRTPMTGILGMVDFLTETNLSPEQKSSVEAITECSKTLLNTLNDILDISKIEAGKLTISNINYNFQSLMENTVKILKVPAAEKNIELRLNIADSSVPRFIHGDPHRLRQAVTNLINNAIKFTEAGSVDVIVSFRNNLIRIDVKDTGIGIHPNKIEYLFKSFSQADSTISQRFGGSGLGLYITKSLVEKMGGKVGIVSTPGAGSTFSIDLPYREPLPEKEEVSKEEGAHESRPQNILLVEDNRINQMVCHRLLTQKGHHVTVADDAESALEHVRLSAYDIILMDCSLPDKSGIEVAKEIRAMGGRLRRVPIIALTANGMEDHMKQCADAGMNDFIIKPYRPERLYQAISLYTQTPSTPIVSDKLKTLLEEMGVEYTAHLIKTALDEVSFLIRKIKKSFEDNNYEQLQQLAHDLKSVGGSIGMQETQSSAENVERACIRKEHSSLRDLVAQLIAAVETEKASFEKS